MDLEPSEGEENVEVGVLLLGGDGLASDVLLTFLDDDICVKCLLLSAKLLPLLSFDLGLVPLLEVETNI